MHEKDPNEIIPTSTGGLERKYIEGTYTLAFYDLNVAIRHLGWSIAKAWHLPQLVEWLNKHL